MKKSSLTLAVFNYVFPVSLLIVTAFFTIFCLCGSSALADNTVSGHHTLTATISGQGSISPSGTLTVPKGTSKAFVFEAEENHCLVDVLVDGVSVGPLDAFSFENIDTSHTIEAVYKSSTATLAAK